MGARASALDPATALRSGAVRHLAIANPQHAPYGRAAEAALRHMGLWDAVQAKLVLGENIAQTLQFVQSGAADAGIVALSLALAPAARGQGRYWEIPLDAYPRMEQGGVILKDSRGRARVPRLAALRSAGRAYSQTVRLLLSQANDMDWQAIWLSVRLAASTTAILLAARSAAGLLAGLFAAPLEIPGGGAWWRCRWCCRPPCSASTCCWPWGRAVPLGALYAKLTGGMLPFSFQGC